MLQQKLCNENHILSDINKKRLFQEKYVSEKQSTQQLRKNFLENRNKLSEDQKEKVDLEFSKLLPQEEEKLDLVKELFFKGASVSFLKTDHVFDNFSTFIRKDRFTDDQIERYKIFINSMLSFEDLNSQLADYTENETFYQILFRLEFKHIYNSGVNLFKGAYELFYHSALNFDIALGVKDLLETPYWGIFQKFEYNYEPQYALSENLNEYEAKQRFFDLLDPNANKENFEFQMKFLDLITDNLNKLEEHPNIRKPEMNISEHYNILFTTWDQLEGFYKSKLMTLKNIQDEKKYDFEHENDVQSYEKIIKILIELIPIFYYHKTTFYLDLLDKLFLKFKGLVFKHLENNQDINEDIKETSRNYLFKKYFGICLDNKPLSCGNLDLENLIEKTDYYKNLHKNYFENQEDMNLLYKCIVTFYQTKTNTDVIEKILKYEKENHSTKFNTNSLLHPLTGEKLFDKNII